MTPQATWHGRPLNWDWHGDKSEEERIILWTIAELEQEEEASEKPGTAELIALIDAGFPTATATPKPEQPSKSKGGRPKGQVRPNEYDEDTRFRMAAAANDVKRIRKLWKEYGQAPNRRHPSAYDVALRRWDLGSGKRERAKSDLKRWIKQRQKKRSVRF